MSGLVGFRGCILAVSKKCISEKRKRFGLVRESNPGPLAPEARIIPLDQQATLEGFFLQMTHCASVVRYAHQTRNIINVARVNEDPNARLIRGLYTSTTADMISPNQESDSCRESVSHNRHINH